MRAIQLLVLSACSWGRGAAAVPPEPPARSTPVAHVDPVPDALERMARWPGLGAAVTGVVMGSPKGRIHGHDAERIDIAFDEGTRVATVRFVMPASFPLHGDRTVSCGESGDGWTCQDTTPETEVPPG